MTSCDTSESAFEVGSPRTNVHSGLEFGGSDLVLHFWSGGQAGEGVEFSTP